MALLLRKRCWTSLFVLLVLVMCMFCLTYTGLQPLRAWTTWRQAPTTVQLSPESHAPLSQTLYGLPSAASQAKSLQNLQNSQYSSVTTASIVSRTSVVPGTISTVSSSFVSSESTADTGKRIFILTQSFGGQLTRAVKNMMVQQCWARDLGPDVTILEPFSHNSQLLHTPQIWESVKRGQTQNVARFSDYFDLELYNAASLKDEGAPLIKWEEFLIQAPRQAVVVVTPQGSCSQIINRHLHTAVNRLFKDFLKTLENMNFKILKIVPVDCYDKQKLNQLLLANMHNATIVFNSWRNYNVARTWLGVSTRCGISDKYPADRLRPSAIMKRHTHKYRAEVLGANKTIAIMLRVERFLTLKSSRAVDDTVESCLEKTLGVYSDLREDPRWSNSSPFLTLDIGRYGSGLMQSNKTVQRMDESLDSVTASVTQFLVKVYGGRWTSLEEWEDSFLVATEGIAERGYVAMLQRQIAVESDCLVLMGGGSFQEVAANHYLIAHPDPAHQCLHVVCSATALTTTLENSQQRWRNKKPAMGRLPHQH